MSDDWVIANILCLFLRKCRRRLREHAGHSIIITTLYNISKQIVKSCNVGNWNCALRKHIFRGFNRRCFSARLFLSDFRASPDSELTFFSPHFILLQSTACTSRRKNEIKINKQLMKCKFQSNNDTVSRPQLSLSLSLSHDESFSPCWIQQQRRRWGREGKKCVSHQLRIVFHIFFLFGLGSEAEFNEL